MDGAELAPELSNGHVEPDTAQAPKKPVIILFKNKKTPSWVKKKEPKEKKEKKPPRFPKHPPISEELRAAYWERRKKSYDERCRKIGEQRLAMLKRQRLKRAKLERKRYRELKKRAGEKKSRIFVVFGYAAGGRHQMFSTPITIRLSRAEVAVCLKYGPTPKLGLRALIAKRMPRPKKQTSEVDHG